MVFSCGFQQENSEAVSAYVRIFQENGYITFGQVVIAEKTWGIGLGNQLVKKFWTFAGNNGQDIIIELQEQVIKCYEKHGFEISGNIFSSKERLI